MLISVLSNPLCAGTPRHAAVRRGDGWRDRLSDVQNEAARDPVTRSQGMPAARDLAAGKSPYKLSTRDHLPPATPGSVADDTPSTTPRNPNPLSYLGYAAPKADSPRHSAAATPVVSPRHTTPRGLTPRQNTNPTGASDVSNCWPCSPCCLHSTHFTHCLHSTLPPLHPLHAASTPLPPLHSTPLHSTPIQLL